MNARLTIAISLLLGASMPGLAGAHDHEVPTTVSRVRGEQIQRGKNLASCWIIPSENSDYILDCTDYSWSFPRVDQVRAKQKVTLRIKKEQMPTSASIHAWARLNKETGEPIGNGTEIKYLSRPVLGNDSEIWAWDFVFEVPKPDRRYYLRLAGEWPDEEFPQEFQTAQWTFYLRAR